MTCDGSQTSRSFRCLCYYRNFIQSRAKPERVSSFSQSLLITGQANLLAKRKNSLKLVYSFRETDSPLESFTFYFVSIAVISSHMPTRMRLTDTCDSKGVA